MKNSKLAALAVAATLAVTGTAVTVGSATAANGQDTTCTPQAAVLSAWTSAGKLPVQHENTPPVDPDGTDEASTTNLVKFEGPVTTKHVTVEAQPATEDTLSDWSAWTPYGDNPYLSEPSVPANTNLHEYRVNGPVKVVDQEGTEDTTVTQHFSWTGGPVEGTPPVPTSPEGDDNWQPNTEQEPPGHLNSTENPDGTPYDGDGLHFASHGNSGNGDWFFFGSFVIPGEEEVSHNEWTAEERTRTVIPGQPAVAEVSHTDYQWEKFTRTFTPAVECPETPTETPTVPTETPTVPTETPTTPTETPEVPDETTPVTPEETPETPETTPQPPKTTPQPPKDVQVVECVDGVFVTSVNGEVISEAGSCEVREGNDEPVTFSETGL